MLKPLNCPQCGSPLKYVPAGVSKTTGKPYTAFWSCSNQCGYTWRPSAQKSKAVKNNDKVLNALREIYKKQIELEVKITKIINTICPADKKEKDISLKS